MNKFNVKLIHFGNIPHDLQQIMLAQNILQFAKSYQKEKIPIYQIVANCHYHTANMIMLQLTKGDMS